MKEGEGQIGDPFGAPDPDLQDIVSGKQTVTVWRKGDRGGVCECVCVCVCMCVCGVCVLWCACGGRKTASLLTEAKFNQPSTAPLVPCPDNLLRRAQLECSCQANSLNGRDHTHTTHTRRGAGNNDGLGGSVV